MADSLDSGSSVHYGRAGSSPASRTKKTDQPFAGLFFYCNWRDLKSASKNTSAAQDFWEQPLIMVALSPWKVPPRAANDMDDGAFYGVNAIYPKSAWGERERGGYAPLALFQLRTPKACSHQKKTPPVGGVFFWCERWDLNPHVHSNTSTSSLPVCRFQHARIPKRNT